MLARMEESGYTDARLVIKKRLMAGLQLGIGGYSVIVPTGLCDAR
jgi:hypothetical protein